jgi:hypothetical protein
MTNTGIEDMRKLIALACEYGAMIDIVFEKGGDVRISVYPPDKPTEEPGLSRPPPPRR